MAKIGLPTKNQFAFTHVVSPSGSEMITIGQSIFTRVVNAGDWKHEQLSDYFAGNTVIADEEKHDDVLFPFEGIEQHFFTNSGVEMIVANNLLYYRVYPTEKTWHVTVNTQPVSQDTKRLIISPIAHVSLEKNMMSVDSGDTGFRFTVEEIAVGVANQFKCKSCLQTFQAIPAANATTICTFCSCPDVTIQS